VKQTYRSWNLHFDEAIKEFGFIKNVEKACAYKMVNGSAVVFLVLFVDDILLIENDILMMEVVKSSLRKFLNERFRRNDIHFRHKDL
jgi:hypothetical protein